MTLLDCRVLDFQAWKKQKFTCHMLVVETFLKGDNNV